MAMCRACLSVDDNLQPLFDGIHSIKMATCVNVPVTQEDNLPDKICCECINNLEIAFQFKTKCESSYQVLINASKNINLKNDLVENAIINNVSNEYEKNDNNQSYELDIVPDIRSIEKVTKCNIKNDKSSNKKIKIDPKKYGYFIIANKDDVGLDQDYLEALYKIYKHRCNHCPRIYAVSTYFKVHINSHLGIKPYYCKQCKKNFHDERSHIKYHKQRKEKGSFKCQYCEKAYNSASSLRTHIKVHTGELKWFSCTQCLKKFTQLNKLKNHMIVHTNERNFVCQYCSKAFKFSRNLKVHIASVHVKVKSFMCDSCSKGFATSHELTLHKRRHLGIKNHQCKMCSLSFVSASEAQSHLLSVHMKNKNYACRICGAKFSRSTHRKNHEQSKRCVINMFKNPTDQSVE